VRLSAEQAGVCDKTVYKHIAKDPEFEEAFGLALRIGFLRLEARQMQEAQRFALRRSGAVENAVQDPSTIESSFDGSPPLPAAGEEYEIRILDDELFEEHFDPELAMHLLREHKRGLPGVDRRRHQRTTAESATAREVAEALAKRLKGFALRVSKEKKE
jgi:hypothetical protein